MKPSLGKKRQLSGLSACHRTSSDIGSGPSSRHVRLRCIMNYVVSAKFKPFSASLQQVVAGPGGPVAANGPDSTQEGRGPIGRAPPEMGIYRLEVLTKLSRRASTTRPWGGRSADRRRKVAVLRRRAPSRLGSGRQAGSPGGASHGSPHPGRSRRP